MTEKTILTDEQKDRFVSEICQYGTGFVAPLHSVVEAIEQAVLQSPEIQALRKDAERIQFVADEGCVFNTWVQTDGTTKYRLEWDAGSSVSEWQDRWFDSPRESIDAAMEKQP